MASPRPIAVVRLSAKIETWVNRLTTNSTKNVPMIDSTPMATGRPAAITLPNTTMSSSSVIGMATPSALARSDSIVVPT